MTYRISQTHSRVVVTPEDAVAPKDARRLTGATTRDTAARLAAAIAAATDKELDLSNL